MSVPAEIPGRKKPQLILASRSPRRQFLLKELGFSFDIQVRETDESFPAHLQAEKIALYLCKKKANAFNPLPAGDTLYLTADTIVWINNRVLNKPADEKEAVEMLNLLSGNRHEVFTGVCIRSQREERLFFVKSAVYFRKLESEEIRFYITHYKPFDKAGAYGAQECLPEGINPCSPQETDFLTSIGKKSLIDDSIRRKSTEKSFHCIEKIEGSFFNVMGLPVIEVYHYLQECKNGRME